MGKLNLPSVYEPSDARKSASSGKFPAPSRERSSAMRMASPTHDVASSSASVSAVPKGTVCDRRTTISVNQPMTRESNSMPPARSRPRSVPPTGRTLGTKSPAWGPPRPHSTLPQERELQRAIQGRYPSILECLYSFTGDAQASPSNGQDTMDVSPVSVAARHVQERGRSARAQALQTVGALLKRVEQRKVDKEDVRNVFFTVCVDKFAREPCDNIEEISLAFQLLSILVQEDIMPGADFVRAALALHDEGHYDGCKLLIELVRNDDKVKLEDEEMNILTDIASTLKPGGNKGKEKAP